MGVAGCLRGRPRPRLGGGESSSTWRAFPFSTAENLFGGAMKEKEKQEGMDRKGRRRPVLIAGGGQPPASTTIGNHDPLCMQGPDGSHSCQGIMGKQGRPRPINRHAAPKAAGYWGPRCSELDPWLRCEAKPERTWGPGATVGVLGTGVPRLACLWPAAWLKGRPSMAHLHQHKLKTLARGQASRGG